VSRLELKGTPICPGVALGPAWVVVDPAAQRIPRRELVGEDAESALARFEQARQCAIEDLKRIQAATTRELGLQDAAIYGAQIAVLQDPDALASIRRFILEEHLEPESAVQALIDRFADLFQNLEGGEIKNWGADLRDPWSAVIRELAEGGVPAVLAEQEEGVVLVAEELTPSLVTRRYRHRIVGILASRGGRFSHGAVLARSFGLPCVTGLEGVHLKAAQGESCVVFGGGGRALLGATSAEESEARRLAEERVQLRSVLLEAAQAPGVTADGSEVKVMVNIESPRDLETFDTGTAAGVGLFRTEFAYMERPSFPSVDEQTALYEKVLAHFPGKPVVFRTLDIGGDKRLRYFQHPQEANPAMGWRGLRLSLEWQDLFLIQVSALVRARDSGDARIMLPMVTTIEELHQARDLIAQVCAGRQSIPVGIMIEVPAAAMVVRELAAVADFVSIGTNDLTQYLFAVDRDNPWVSKLYQPYHPAHLRVLRHIAKSCNALGTPVSVCGEMAGQRAGALFLVGAGIRSLSAAPPFLPEIKAVLREAEIEDLRALANRAAAAETSAEALGILRRAVEEYWSRILARNLRSEGA